MSHGHDSIDNAHGHGGADHVPHVTPIWHYFGVFGALLTLTAITVGVSYMDFGPWNLVIAMVVATTKALLVAAIFMHLLYDKKFHSVVFSTSIIFLAIFIAFTSFDTFARGRAEAIEGLRPGRSDDPWSKDLRASPKLQPRQPHFGATLEAEHHAGGEHHAAEPEHKAGHNVEAPAEHKPEHNVEAPAEHK
jgi:cytochrome c oxidase subunit 4